MPDSEPITALVPLTPPESRTGRTEEIPQSPPIIESEETDAPADLHDSAAAVRHRTGFAAVLKKCVLLFFSVLTLLIAAGVLVSSVREAGIGEDFLIRLLLSDVFGTPDGKLTGIRTAPSEALTQTANRPARDHLLPEESPLSSLAVTNPSADQPAAEQDKPDYSAAELSLTNETPYKPDMNELLLRGRVIPEADALYEIHGTDAPLVLILHTHGTEAFADSAADGYRSTDPEKNIVSAGKVIAETLDSYGIHTIHCTELFDAEDFTMAYYNASLEIRRTLEQYPSISYIIDVHRDSVEVGGVPFAPSVQSGGITAAQMMFVIGTDHGGSGHDSWENNLSLAARLQAALNENTPKLMRNINLRSASFNEQYSDGSLLLEIGACASSLEEVCTAASLFADALAEEILGE
ncbi:MAG: stage II sporulation protein P [Clostridia bacterium]|nr:stage II sporulation protein P [Clostridia bacterium]